MAETAKSKIKEKRRKRKWITRIIVISIILIVSITGIYFIHRLFNQSYTLYKVLGEYGRTDSTSVKYESYGGRLLKYSKDGASAINSAGDIIWNGSYEMKNPIARICNNYVAIADIGEKEVYIFNGEDSGTLISVLSPIITIDVAGQGLVAIAIQEENDADSNLISIHNPYDVARTELLEIPTSVKEDGYPIDIAISDDGKKLVTSFMKLSNGVMENRVTFYNFSETAQGDKNRMKGMENFENILIPNVDFLNNNTVCAYADNGFTLFQMNQIPEKIYSETFDETIKNSFSNNKYIGFVLESYETKEKYKVIVYDFSGTKILDTTVDYDYDNVYISGNEIIFYTEMQVFIMRLNGTIKWDYKFNESISYFMPVNNKTKYFLINNTNIQLIKLTGGKSS